MTGFRSLLIVDRLVATRSPDRLHVLIAYHEVLKLLLLYEDSFSTN